MQFVQQVLQHVFRTHETQTAALRRTDQEIIQLQVLREGIRQPRGPKDAHKDTHAAVRLQNVWESFLQTLVAAGTHSDAYR